MTPASSEWLHDDGENGHFKKSFSVPRQLTLLTCTGPMPFPNPAFFTAIPYLLKFYQRMQMTFILHTTIQKCFSY